jgi:hypothetical protein
MAKMAAVNPHIKSLWNVVGPALGSGLAKGIAEAGGVERGSLKGIHEEGKRLVDNVRASKLPPEKTDYVTPGLAAGVAGVAAYGAGSYLAND